MCKWVREIGADILIAFTIDLFNRQPEAYADAATNIRLRLTVKRNTVQIVAVQRELPGECLQDAGSPDGLRRFRYFAGRSLNGLAARRTFAARRTACA